MLGMGRVCQHNFVDVFWLLKNEGNLILTSWRKVNYINNRPFHHSFIYGYSMYCTRSNCRKLWNYTQPRRYSLTEYRIECIYSSVFRDGIMARPSLDYIPFSFEWYEYYIIIFFILESAQRFPNTTVMISLIFKQFFKFCAFLSKFFV